MKTANLTITTRKTVEDLPKVKRFLESVGRNSVSSQQTYFTGLLYLQNFLGKNYPSHSVETILSLLNERKVDLYELLDDFVSYLASFAFSVSTVKLYMAGIRSYLAYYDIDIIPSKFKRKVKMPRHYREDEEPLDASDIRKILLACNNRRLKPYLLTLGSGGFRANEALAIRLKDIDFTCSPTKIHVRKEYAKTKVAREVYISDEATLYLKKWIEWKYRDKSKEGAQRFKTLVRNEEDLVFTTHITRNTMTLYPKVLKEFEKLLDTSGFSKRKEEGKQKRRKITLHSFRRFVKTVITDESSSDYSEWFLGHSKSPYYTKKEPERRQIYASKCMKYLTFLDYSALEATGKSIEAKLKEKDSEMQAMRMKYEQDMQKMREEMESRFQQILAKINVANLK